MRFCSQNGTRASLAKVAHDYCSQLPPPESGTACSFHTGNLPVRGAENADGRWVTLEVLQFGRRWVLCVSRTECLTIPSQQARSALISGRNFTQPTEAGPTAGIQCPVPEGQGQEPAGEQIGTVSARHEEPENWQTQAPSPEMGIAKTKRQQGQPEQFFGASTHRGAPWAGDRAAAHVCCHKCC